MPYIVEKWGEKLQDAIADPRGWANRGDVYRQTLDDNARMRSEHEERGAFGRLHVPEWKYVASFPSTLRDAMDMIDEDRFIKDKKRFYSWLRRNKGWAVYDIKSVGA